MCETRKNGEHKDVVHFGEITAEKLFSVSRIKRTISKELTSDTQTTPCLTNGLETGLYTYHRPPQLLM
jgi:hypothetical protein